MALEYVLCQPFPTFPLISPCTVQEPRSSLTVLDAQLTPSEMNRIGYPDFIWEDGLYITETQKTKAESIET